MNISKPVTVKNYNKTVSKIIDAVNVVDVVYHKVTETKKIGCVGHYQKRVGTWSRNLKEKE